MVPLTSKFHDLAACEDTVHIEADVTDPGTPHGRNRQKLGPALTGVSVAVAAETVAIDRYIRRRYSRIVPVFA
jgi:hypothetical protein